MGIALQGVGVKARGSGVRGGLGFRSYIILNILVKEQTVENISSCSTLIIRHITNYNTTTPDNP